MYKKSQNPKIEELTKSETVRQYPLQNVPTRKADGKRFCVWCDTNELKNKNARYCSDECRSNMYAWGYPQKEEGLGLLLIRQDYKCNMCQYDWAPIIEQIIAETRIPPVPRNFDFRTKYNWALIKRLKSRSESSKAPEVDHIVPIYKGGQSLGLENHQAICYTCHKAKSKVDNSGPRKVDPELKAKRKEQRRRAKVLEGIYKKQSDFYVKTKGDSRHSLPWPQWIMDFFETLSDDEQIVYYDQCKTTTVIGDRLKEFLDKKVDK